MKEGTEGSSRRKDSPRNRQQVILVHARRRVRVVRRILGIVAVTALVEKNLRVVVRLIVSKMLLPPSLLEGTTGCCCNVS